MHFRTILMGAIAFLLSTAAAQADCIRRGEGYYLPNNANTLFTNKKACEARFARENGDTGTKITGFDIQITRLSAADLGLDQPAHSSGEVYSDLEVTLTQRPSSTNCGRYNNATALFSRLLGSSSASQVTVSLIVSDKRIASVGNDNIYGYMVPLVELSVRNGDTCVARSSFVGSTMLARVRSERASSLHVAVVAHEVESRTLLGSQYDGSGAASSVVATALNGALGSYAPLIGGLLAGQDFTSDTAMQYQEMFQTFPRKANATMGGDFTITKDGEPFVSFRVAPNPDILDGTEDIAGLTSFDRALSRVDVLIPDEADHAAITTEDLGDALNLPDARTLVQSAPLVADACERIDDKLDALQASDKVRDTLLALLLAEVNRRNPSILQEVNAICS